MKFNDIRRFNASGENEMRFIIVKRGDTLSSIALKAYGSVSKYKKIIKANPTLIKKKKIIYPGQRLRIPK